ncbi:hypothetical protein UMM65_03590 [Aureibaculum sp. 2210JD6-5]|uniref:hypothetical protein n=1 Tax=Aureibaculum sp. 2210JD6-5 TaxID=3103957 RepID=UPI002AACAD91|nr:hypothetical protein [Aureibaculum sp. 2210JD6-5]MDY7394309.1 hypothetical protein [Aureibaculum sp. 2210JD6-5]
MKTKRMNSKLSTIFANFMLVFVLCLGAQSSFSLENYSENKSKEIKFSPEDEINELMKKAIKSPIFNELYEYHLKMFLWNLKLDPKQKQLLSKTYIEDNADSIYSAESFGFENSQDFTNYLELSQRFKAKFKLGGMDEDLKNEFLMKIRMYQLEKILNDDRVKGELLANKKLATYVKNMMNEEVIDSKKVFTFSCYKCAYDYHACLQPIQSHMTISNTVPERWNIEISSTYVTEVLMYNPPFISSDYTEELCLNIFKNCMEECDPNWGN